MDPQYIVEDPECVEVQVRLDITYKIPRSQFPAWVPDEGVVECVAKALETPNNGHLSAYTRHGIIGVDPAIIEVTRVYQ